MVSSEGPESETTHIGTVSGVQDFADDFAVVIVNCASLRGGSELFAVIQSGNERKAILVLENEMSWSVGDRVGNLKSDLRSLQTLLEIDRWPSEDLNAFLNNSYEVDPLLAFKHAVELIETHIDFPATEVATVVALWTMSTYLYRLFNAFPYLALTGPKGSGKTKVLEVLECLSFNPLFTANITTAALFRSIEAASPTVLIDEAEILAGGESTDLRFILQSGYRSGAQAVRASGEGYSLQKFDLYSPKAIANIEGLEATLADRTIPITMWKTSKLQGRLNIERQDPRWGVIRGQFYSMALSRHGEIAEIYRSDDEELFRLQNRIGELWRPLLTVAAFLDNLKDNGLVGLIQRAQDQHSEDVTANAFDPWDLALAAALLNLVEGESSLVTPRQIVDKIKERLGPDELSPNAYVVGRMMHRLKLGFPRRTGYERRYLVRKDVILDFLGRVQG